MATVPLHVPLDDPAIAGISRRTGAVADDEEEAARRLLGALLVVIVLMAIFADVLAPYDPLEPHPEIRLSRRAARTRSGPTTSAATS
jgi:hypothetical protein